ncbi:ABC transporter permease [Bacteroidota bacterium]
MIGNFIKIGIRNLIKQKGFTILNLLGLAVGMAGFILILLYVDNELSYEKFNDKADRIYRVYLDGKLGSQEIKDAATPDPMAEVLMNEFPEVEIALRYRHRGKTLITYENNKFYEQEVKWTDSSFFKVFSIPLIIGDIDNILNRKYTVVLTETMAGKLFGKEDPIGKSIKMDDGNVYEVTGVCIDPPKNSHISFNVLIAYISGEGFFESHWGSNNMPTYVLIKEGALETDLESHFPDMVIKYMGPIIQEALGMSMDEFYEQGSRWGFYLEPLLGIHLESEVDQEGDGMGSKTFVYIIGLIGLFILLIACINYINLSTAKSFARAREVGIRKVIGSSKSKLIIQFLTESIVLSVAAFIIAFLIVILILPAFNNFSGKEIDSSILGTWKMIKYFIMIFVITGILSGGYNAFYTSSVNVISALKSKKGKSKGNSWFRNSLVVFQFTISIFLIISATVVFNQVKFLHNRDLGFKKEGILVIEETNPIGNQYRAFKKELEDFPGILNVSASRTVPGKSFSGNGILKESEGSTTVHVLFRLPVDYDYYETMGLELVEGRFFSPEYATDSIALILNEAAVISLELEDPLNEVLIEPSDSVLRRPIIGIIKDINYNSLYQDIRPMAIEFIGNRDPGYISVSIQDSEEKQVVDYIKTKWEEFVNERPFEYFFLDEELNNQYKTEIKLSKLFGIFSLLAVFIACLGLLGLASFSATRRTGEIGVRKVLGSSVTEVSSLLVKEFTRWVLLANLFGWPIAYWAMTKWLNNFPYNDGIKIWIFVTAGIISLVIAVLTVGYHAIMAARKNPADAIRHE